MPSFFLGVRSFLGDYLALLRGAIFLLLDQALKHWSRENYASPAEGISFAWNRLRLFPSESAKVVSHGAYHSLEWVPFLAWGVLAAFAFVRSNKNRPFERMIFAIMLGAGASNLIDYLLFGSVLRTFQFVLRSGSGIGFSLADLVMITGSVILGTLMGVEGLRGGVPSRLNQRDSRSLSAPS